MADKNTMEKNMVNFARVLVEMPILDRIPVHIHFEDEQGMIQQQRVEFEWKPVFCGKCKKYGHEEEHCKKKEGQVEWRPKAVQPAQQLTQQHNAEEWIQVGRSKDVRGNQPLEQHHTPIRNGFGVLQEDDMEQRPREECMIPTTGIGEILSPHG